MEASTPTPPPPERAWQHALDERLTNRLTDFFRRRLPKDLRQDVCDLYFGDTEPEAADGLIFSAWSFYEAPLESPNDTVAGRFLARHEGTLSPKEKGWLAAQQRAWLSIWEVTEVRPGEGVGLLDRLSGETRFAHEVSGSRVLRPHHVILARVVDHEGVSLVAGMHGSPLPPREGEEVVKTARKALRAGRARYIALERIRADTARLGLVWAWRGAVQAMREAPLPNLRNTDGDPLLLTKDRFAFAPSERHAIGTAIGRMEGAEPEGDEDTLDFVLHREGNRVHKSWDNTMIGHVSVKTDGLVAETNSVARADALRRRLEEACGPHLAFRSREHTDPTALIEAGGARTQASAIPRHETAPEQQEALRDFKARHYEGWLDERIPALAGKTPREAVRTAKGRERVQQLLKELEFREAGCPAGERFDVVKLRRSLGLVEVPVGRSGRGKEVRQLGLKSERGGV